MATPFSVMESQKDPNTITSTESLTNAENIIQKRQSLLDVQGGGLVEQVDPLSDSTFEFEDNPHDRDFTWRAALMGGLLGAIIGLSNIYLGLKLGITQGASLFATLLGSVILRPVLALSNRINHMHSHVGPKEHCCFQASASAAGGLNGGLVAGVIGLFWLQYDDTLDAKHRAGAFVGSTIDNALKIFLIVLSAVCFGVFMAVPYRKVFIINQNLQFPDGLASAEIIKSMYRKGRDKAQAQIQRKKVIVMAGAFLVGLVGYLLSQFFPALILWNIFQNLSSCGAGQSVDDCLMHPPMGSGNASLPVYPVWAYAAAWGWKLSFDPVMVGTAFIVPHHVNFWFFLGGILAFGVIGPISLSKHEYPAGYSTAKAMKYIKDKTLLWPAIFVVLAASFINIALEYKAFDGMFGGIKGSKETAGNKKGFLAKNVDEVKEFVKKKPDANIDRSDENTPLFVWMPWMIVFMILSFIIYVFYFGTPYGIQWWMVIDTFLACILLALVFLQILGKTNWGLISVMGKVIVMTLGVIGAPISAMLMMGNMVAQTMSQIGDLISCYKTGHVIKASPQAQFMANVVGSAFGLFTSICGFFLFTASTPCILQYPTPDNCPYEVPSAKAWYLLAKAFSNGFSIGQEPKDTMTWTGLYVSCIMTGMAIITNSLKKYMSNSSPNFKKWQGLFPLYAVLFVPFLIGPDVAVATFVGTLIKFVWQVMSKPSVKLYAISVGAGLMTGGAMGGALYAVLRIAGLTGKDQLKWGMAPY